MSALRPLSPFSTRLFVPALMLASTSAIRRSMLHNAGAVFDAVSPDLEESELKTKFNEASEIASELACAKAANVSTGYPEKWVIGSDSVVQVKGRLFDKPQDRETAAEHLRFFSGNMMCLTSAVALARDGNVDWRHVETARLRVRLLSEEFVTAYLDAEWPEVGYTVGVFRLESRGVQLFESIEGDYFTILGMPLMPLLGALRERGLLLA